MQRKKEIGNATYQNIYKILFLNRILLMLPVHITFQIIGLLDINEILTMHCTC